MLIDRSFAALVALSCTMLVSASSQDFERRTRRPTGGPRHIHITTRAEAHDASLSRAEPLRRREVRPQQGGMVFPLGVRNHDTPLRRGMTAHAVGANAVAGDGSSDSKKKQGSGMSGPNNIVLDYYLDLNVTLDGVKTQLVVDGGDELMAPGAQAEDTPFTAPKASDTGLKYKYMDDGGSVHKSDLTFGDGHYTVKGVAYGTHEGHPKYSGGFGIGVPGKRLYPKGSPPSLSEALVKQLQITSFSVVLLNDWALMLNQDPFVDVDEKALMGSVAPSGNSWLATGTINGTSLTTDFSPVNKHIYGDDQQIQKFFGNQKPTKRGDDPSNYYDVPCAGGPPIEFSFGGDNGIKTVFSGAATNYEDKESSTGCTSILIGQKPDPTRFRTAWTFGNSFQYHITPSFHFSGQPSIQFFGRPESLYQ